jgi:hypothetical protein
MKQPSRTLGQHAVFDDKIHRLGMISVLVVWFFFLMVPTVVTLYFKLEVKPLETLWAAAPLMLILMITGLCEKFSMAPIIGPGAVYLASSTGNIQNMKLPAALNAMNIMECEEGSEKGRVISIIAVATSSFVTTVIVLCGMLFLAPLMEPLMTNPVITPAFDNIFPALVGPMVIPVVLKNLKTAVLPVLLAIVFALILGSLYSTVQSIVMVGVILISLGVYRVVWRKKERKESAE